MVTRRDVNAGLLSGVLVATVPGVAARAQALVTLPAPQTEGGLPLMQALKRRRSDREFSEQALAPQVLSNLLWVAWGVNRPDSGLRTAPSSHGTMNVDIYVAMASGVWFYDAKANRLIPHLPDDIRGETTTGQPFAKTAPVNLIYVSDAARMEKVSDEDRLLNGIADSMSIAQNVYLFCASEGLATVVRGSVPGEKLARRLKLSATQEIYLAQSVGYPKP
jgi:nitroreductase